ncbi:Glutamine synthetase type III domain-containing protein [Gemmatirosa kalamazoonensis]|uniref:Glutamine synthetase type III domain-containing protein n=1 Tax=Gemmatirosa kalamazoonensis TaxID=861299 RepID=W0RCC3_9BACT|nr:glutamine synthetase III [Gemmatirosa kalamazoonensis]AHG87975.1 Glutamine synthetase type III domain-containing protein [Gemmatirosa kalamazoonensis]
MATAPAAPRKAALHDMTVKAPALARLNGDAKGGTQTSQYFGQNTFGARQMRDKLPKKVFQKLQATIRLGKKLDSEIAAPIAEAIKEWAVSKGVTHYTHWFQPQTGLTAEKHDAFLSFDDEGTPIEAFSAAQLIQSEPDASSFPSGGLRATWEARGYTAWNPASPVFVVEGPGTRTLCIPSVFIGYNGEALDEMTPLLRSSDVLSEKAIALLELLGDSGVQRVITTLGPEQEYFLIDRTQFALRPDLVMAGRTLVGAAPPRGQQLEDHYFGNIPERIAACIAEVEHELYKLGVPIVTRHNEVAPSQFEMAPRFEETDLAVDHNQLVMSTLRRVALRHGLQALLHEKPFAGINGSGKHCNWSMSLAADSADLDGLNLLKPGKTPHQNVRFLIFLAAVLQAVHKHAGLLRAGIGTSGNEHRLGANEAPPAIISVFMGQTLSQMIDDISAGRSREKHASQQLIDLGVAKLPDIEKDNTDRNRTSPFAFTGNKFEFRAVGSSQSIAFPVMLLNVAVAEAIEDLTNKLRKQLETTKEIDDAVLEVVRPSFKASASVLFEGNNYSDEWVQEAERRGLLNLRRTPEALAQLTTESTRKLFASTGVLSEAELESRYHVRVERYVKDMLIELHTLQQIVDTLVLPAAYSYANELATGAAHAKSAGVGTIPQVAAADRVGKLIVALEEARGALGEVVTRAEHSHESPDTCAKLLTSEGADAMAAVRAASDALELGLPDDHWPLPKYREMLFPV